MNKPINQQMDHYIQPNWPAPTNVKAYTTKRTGGFSLPPYDSFNFSLRTGDKHNDVLANRHQLYQQLSLPDEPFWLQQEHTNIALFLDNNTTTDLNNCVVADATFTATPGKVCVVTTADCVPILLCNQDGTMVASIHAGWKGIAADIIGSTIKAITNTMNIDPSTILAWLGPAIGPNAFVVNSDLVDIFCQRLPENEQAFVQYNDKFLANIYLLASISLQNNSITKIFGGEYCTFTNQDLFFSFRRDGEKSGRMANLIWLAA